MSTVLRRAAALLTIAAGTACVSDPTAPLQSGQAMLLTSDRVRDPSGAPTYEIFVMNADGSNVVQLTNNDWADSLPRWSPDLPFDQPADARSPQRARISRRLRAVSVQARLVAGWPAYRAHHERDGSGRYLQRCARATAGTARTSPTARSLS